MEEEGKEEEEEALWGFCQLPHEQEKIIISGIERKKKFEEGRRPAISR